MIEPNWDIFRAKFSGNPQYNFEWLCYLLFCEEFGRPYGIHRYINQAAIETDPIKENGEVIGFQAKFYGDPLSEHKGDLLETVKNAKRLYPNITKLLIYTNRDWGQANGKPPQGKTEIEEKAQELGIELEWRGHSFFESPLVATKSYITEYFFKLDRGVFNSIKEIRDRTKTILAQIQTRFHINNHSFDIDTSECRKQLKSETPQVSILSGGSGVGKTAIIKQLFGQRSDDTPFYVFRAIEFRISRINELFSSSSLCQFVEIHKYSKVKIVVIDSAEKLFDIDNLDPFRELLLVLIENGWKVIFTISDARLENLLRFLEAHKIAPLHIEVKVQKPSDLQDMSKRHSFALPKNKRLLDLIRTPFYLNEYLKRYNDVSGLNYDDFKAELWRQNIIKANPDRAECFMKIASSRANTGLFFINNPDYDSNLIQGLLADGILGYDETMGYFITHDIYEEWALEKLVQRAFAQKLNHQDFFEKIGQSHPIRRIFRNWVSEKLMLNEDDIVDFIESVLRDTDIEQSWKDEVLISVLLSNYSDRFFERFKDELLADEQKLLKSIVHLIRTFCKTIDDNLLRQLNVVFMKPNGPGWESLIKFVYDNIGTIGIGNAFFILPVIHDWNSEYKEDNTTKLSSLIALKLYEKTTDPTNRIIDPDGIEDKIVETIVYGASQIKDELSEICEEILRDGRRGRYYKLSKFILEKIESWPLSKTIPEYVLKMATLFWLHDGSRRDSWPHAKIELSFGLDPINIDLYEVSAYRTPIYKLLEAHPKLTLKFILDFVNKSIQSYVKSGIDSDVTEVDVWIGNDEPRKQYVSERLWCMYRGLGAPSPSLLLSIHMALEKYLLEYGAKAESRDLEQCLIQLLKNTESASISSVVASVVRKYPDKTFNVAKVLFQTKEFFSFEISRLYNEETANFSYLLGSNLDYYRGRTFFDERTKANEMSHHKIRLEAIFLRYRIVKLPNEDENDFIERLRELEGILDRYYKNLPSKSNQSKADKVWRMSLAMMDWRKMSVSTEKGDDGTHTVKFDPALDPDLNEHRQRAKATADEAEQHQALHWWALYKFEKNDKHQTYEQYETNPHLALSETKDVIAKLDKVNSIEQSDTLEEAFARLSYLHQTTPSFVCAVILRDHIKDLTEEEKTFCYDVVLGVAGSTLHLDYQYGLSDGVEPSFAVLPILFKALPKNRDVIKIILLRALFDNYEVGYSYDSKGLRSFSIKAICVLWEINFDAAQSLLLGYILLASLHNQLCDENYRNYKYSSNELLEKIFNENDELLRDIIENRLTLSSLLNDLEEKHIGKLSLTALNAALQLIPQKPDNDNHKRIAQMLITAFANKVLGNDRYDDFDYTIVSRLLDTYAHFVLRADKEEVEGYLKPFICGLKESKFVVDLLKAFIMAQNKLRQYENFWLVWDKFKATVIELRNTIYGTEIIETYLFTQGDAGEGNSLMAKNRDFFRQMSNEIGSHPATLHAISKLLCGADQLYLDDGVSWVSTMLANDRYADDLLERNTAFYIERLMERYIDLNREKIKKNPELKSKVIMILDHLIKNGSSTGSMLIESIS